VSHRLPKIAPIALVLAVLCGCGPAVPGYRIAELPSGRTLRVLDLSEAEFEGGAAGLRLAYETDLAIDDRKALYREVEAIWDEFRLTEFVAGKSVVVITPTTPEHGGWAPTRKAVEYTLRIGPEGSWYLVNSASERAPS